MSSKKVVVAAALGAAFLFKDSIMGAVSGSLPSTGTESADSASTSGVTTPGSGYKPLPAWYTSDAFQAILAANSILKGLIMDLLMPGADFAIKNAAIAAAKAANKKDIRKNADIKAAKGAAIAKAKAAIVQEKANALAKIKLRLAASQQARTTTLTQIRSQVKDSHKANVQAQKGALINQIKANAVEAAKIQSATEKASKAAIRAQELNASKAAGAVTAEQQRSINHANAVAREANRNRTIVIGQNQTRTNKISMANFRFKVSALKAKVMLRIKNLKAKILALKFPKTPSRMGAIKGGASLFTLGLMVYDLVNSFYPTGIPPNDETWTPQPNDSLPRDIHGYPLCSEVTVDGLTAKLCRKDPPLPGENYVGKSFYPPNAYTMGCMPGYNEVEFGMTSRCMLAGNVPGSRGNLTYNIMAAHMPGMYPPIGLGDVPFTQARNRVNDWAWHIDGAPAMMKDARGIEDFFEGNGLREFKRKSAAAQLVTGKDPDSTYKLLGWRNSEGVGEGFLGGGIYITEYDAIKEQNIDDYPTPQRNAEIIIKGGELLSPMQKLTQLFPDMSQADKIAVINEMPPNLPD